MRISIYYLLLLSKFLYKEVVVVIGVVEMWKTTITLLTATFFNKRKLFIT